MDTTTVLFVLRAHFRNYEFSLLAELKPLKAAGFKKNELALISSSTQFQLETRVLNRKVLENMLSTSAAGITPVIFEITKVEIYISTPDIYNILRFESG